MSTLLETSQIFLVMFKSIGYSLRNNLRFSLPPQQADFVTRFVDGLMTNCQTPIREKTTLYRSRIEDLDQELAFDASEMGAPPSAKTTSGRINPEGMPYLYLADSPKTAIAEVRPWKGAQVSVAKFELTRDQNIVSLIDNEPEILEHDLMTGGFKLNLISIIRNMYFSAPAHGSDRLAYLATQYIAEQIKTKGVDGIQYPSVLQEGGTNTVFFDTNIARCLDVKRHVMKNISYDHEEMKCNPPQ